MFTAFTNPKCKSRALHARLRRPFDSWKAHPWLERLEDRLVLSAGDSIGNAIPLSFANITAAAQAAHASGDLTNPGEVRLYQLTI
ncbi:MAG: hypothetical protein ACKVX9_20440, partial [Blastocatellia bacterium]